jgi:hypothetical protein
VLGAAKDLSLFNESIWLAQTFGLRFVQLHEKGENEVQLIP